jgi:HEAT repeat protein
VAEAQVRAALRDTSLTVRIAAATAAGLAKDREAVDLLTEMVNRDRGKPRGSSPPTPPYMRVRIRRFGWFSY